MAIQLDVGVLFLLDCIIFAELVISHRNLVRHKQDEDASPVSETQQRRDDPDLRRKAVLARDEPSSSTEAISIIPSVLDVDRLGLRVRHGGDSVSALALVR